VTKAESSSCCPLNLLLVVVLDDVDVDDVDDGDDGDDGDDDDSDDNDDDSDAVVAVAVAVVATTHKSINCKIFLIFNACFSCLCLLIIRK